MAVNATANLLDANDRPVLGAHPLIGLTRAQIAAALARLGRRVAAGPALVVATTLKAGADLLDVAVGRSAGRPANTDKRFSHPAWTHNPVYRRLMQTWASRGPGSCICWPTATYTSQRQAATTAA